MVNIDCDNTIKITRGNNGFINFRCGNYKLKENDVVHFEIEELNVRIEVGDFTEEGIAVIDLKEEHTAHEKGTYNYNIRVVTPSGINDTVLIGKFVII